MKLFPGRILFDLVLLGTAIWALTIALALPHARSPGQVGPGFFPVAVLCLGIVVLAIILFQDLARERRGTAPALPAVQMPMLLCLGGILAALVAYILIMETAGFLLANSLFLFCVTLLCRTAFGVLSHGRPALRQTLLSARVLVTSALFALVATFVTFYTFTVGFGLVFP